MQDQGCGHAVKTLVLDERMGPRNVGNRQRGPFTDSRAGVFYHRRTHDERGHDGAAVQDTRSATHFHSRHQARAGPQHLRARRWCPAVHKRTELAVEVVHRVVRGHGIVLGGTSFSVIHGDNRARPKRDCFCDLLPDHRPREDASSCLPDRVRFAEGGRIVHVLRLSASIGRFGTCCLDVEVDIGRRADHGR
jgi:hypothetical protein